MTDKIKNILFIMFDQLRFDYLSCSGHPHLKTPNIDRLASKGVRFSHTYVQSPVCGASRMSFYTGRYVSSHGAAWNNFPLKVGEQTIGDHLRKLDVNSWLIGKTHMKVDLEGMDRLGLSTDSVIGARLSECGFDVHTRDDGLWGQGPDGFYDQRRSPFNEYLKDKGYQGENPWANNANAGVSDDGDIASGWLTANAVLPANVDEKDSETPWLTSQMIDFLESDAAQKPWLCHLSYIKPHWPYIVPAPYHDMYGRDQIQPVIRADSELDDPHPIYGAFTQNMVGKAFQRDEVRERVIPAYMGLIKQCDDQMGRLFDYLEKSGRMDDTMIVITSDHGDYLGDHWLGEKELFHDPSVRVPLIIYDPRKSADAARGTVCDALIETIDLAATFVEALGGDIPDHILEGKSLMPFLRGETPDDWRGFAISEYDYSAYPLADKLGIAPRDARLFMVVTKRWKLMHAEGGFRPMLFDLANDPQELNDLGDSPDHSEIIDQLYESLFTWARRNSQRTTMSEATIRAMRKGGSARKGILFGYHTEAEANPELLSKYVGKAPRIPKP
ncbi:MAG: sulfatase-like hydrolase/transferase [Rhodobacteraceae bacterium]|nr:sulfatase-like hydrolase/transferase [Paracoccaceae bacterium]